VSTPDVRRPPRRGSLGTRLTLVIAATVAAVVLLVATGTFVVVAVQLGRDQDVALLREATRVQRSLQDGASLPALTGEDAAGEDAAGEDATGDDAAGDDATGDDAGDGPPGGCAYVGQPACARVVHTGDAVGSGSGPLRTTRAALAVAAGTERSAIATVEGSPDVRTLTLRVYDGEAVMVGIPTTTTDRTVRRIGIALLGTGVVGVLLAMAVGVLAARVGLRPVRDLDASIRRVAATRDPHDRVDVRRDDELGRLATSFNTMLAELAEAEDTQRRFVADASHELRTPLTTLRTNITLLGRDGLPEDTRAELHDAVERELVGMQELVGDLLDLAHGEERPGGDGDDTDPVDLRPVLQEAVERASRHWPSVAFHLALPATGPGVVDGDRERFARLVDVLLDNAGKYSTVAARDGTGEQVVDVGLAMHPSSVVLTVEDHGVGIPEADRTRVFDRFTRSDRARAVPGSGLGLAIAHQIVVRSGGTIEAAARADRDPAGTRMIVTLPTAS
jgi:two-component system sensor histidine kinase MprB